VPIKGLTQKVEVGLHVLYVIDRGSYRDKELLERVQHRFTRLTECFIFAMYRKFLGLRLTDV